MRSNSSTGTVSSGDQLSKDCEIVGLFSRRGRRDHASRDEWKVRDDLDPSSSGGDLLEGDTHHVRRLDRVVYRFEVPPPRRNVAAGRHEVRAAVLGAQAQHHTRQTTRVTHHSNAALRQSVEVRRCFLQLQWDGPVRSGPEADVAVAVDKTGKDISPREVLSRLNGVVLPPMLTEPEVLNAIAVRKADGLEVPSVGIHPRNLHRGADAQDAAADHAPVVTAHVQPVLARTGGMDARLDSEGTGVAARMAAVTGSRPWPEVFDDAFSGRAMSIEERVWRDVYGDEYPVGLDPYSYVSTSELRQFAAEVQVGEGDTLVDIGCGQGGPGLWVAAETNASLIGIDISEVALEGARERARRSGRGNVEFRSGSFEATTLDDGSVDAAMSVDAFLFAPDKKAAAVEIFRILRPGGRLVMTTWDYHRQPDDRPPQLADHRPLLRDAGFNVLSYEDTVRWRERQDAVADGLLASAQECADASGVAVDKVRARLHAMRAMSASMIRRVMIVCERAQP